LPNPCTGGGGTEKITASWMVLNFLLSAALMAAADVRPALVEGFQREKQHRGVA